MFLRKYIFKILNLSTNIKTITNFIFMYQNIAIIKKFKILFLNIFLKTDL